MDLITWSNYIRIFMKTNMRVLNADMHVYNILLENIPDRRVRARLSIVGTVACRRNRTRDRKRHHTRDFHKVSGG